MVERKDVVVEMDTSVVVALNPLANSTAAANRLREHLLAHKLLEPIDQSVATTDGISSEFLAQEASRLIETTPYLSCLFARAEDKQATHDALLNLALPEQMRFKLTVTRELKQPLLEHLLMVTLISHYLALRLQLSKQDTVDLLIAALLHDIGELHTNPALLDHNHQVNKDDLRYVYVHPVTGYLIAQAVAPLHPSAAIAVLQHQERFDGSGYPSGLHEKSISMLARIVGVADACASILARFDSIERLKTVLRLTRRKYDGALIALLQEGFGSQQDSDDAGDIVVLSELMAVANLLGRWGEFRDSLARTNDGSKSPQELTFLFERMDSLHSMLLQFGFDPNSPQQLLAHIADDKKIANELATALSEICWQFTDLQREIIRRKNAINNTLSVEDNRFFNAWLANLQAYLEGARQLQLGQAAASTVLG